MTPYERRNPDVIKGSQKKRIAMGSGTSIQEVNALLKYFYQSKELMKQMTKEGKTVFFSTHILDVAEKLCDRVAIIKNGKIVKTGSMKDIKGDESLEQVFLELGE